MKKGTFFKQGKQKMLALAIGLSFALVASCGNKTSTRSTYPSAPGAANSQNRYSKFRQMSALAQSRKRSQNSGLGLQDKMMMMALESQIKSKQEEEKLAATIAIGGGAALLGVGAVGAVAAAISGKKAARAEAAAREKYYATEIEKAQIAADAKVAQAEIYSGYYTTGPYTPGRYSAPTAAAPPKPAGTTPGATKPPAQPPATGADGSASRDSAASATIPYEEYCTQCENYNLGGCQCNRLASLLAETTTCVIFGAVDPESIVVEPTTEE